MNRKLVLVLSSITLILGSSYFITGKIMQNTVLEQVAKINQQGDFRVSITSYQRGIFTAKATSELTNKLNDDAFTLEHSIVHGPILIGRGISLGIAKVTTTTDSILEDRLSLITIADFDLNATTWLDLRKATDANHNNFKISWEKVSGKFNHDLGFTRMYGSITAPNISLSTPDWNLNISNLQIGRDYNVINDQSKDIGSMQIGEVSFSRKNIELVKMGDINSTFKGTSRDQKIDLTMNIDIERAKIIDQQFAQERFIASILDLDTVHMNELSSFLFSNHKDMTAIAQKYADITGSSKMDVEFPKNFTEALLSYLSFEIYRSSPLGNFDNRPAPEMLRDVANSVHNLVKDALENKLIVDRGSRYAINFDLEPDRLTSQQG